MNALGLVLTCALGLLVGGVLGGFSVALLQQIRTGRIKLPPTIALGPVKLDISGLSPQTGEAAGQVDTSGIAPLIEGGSSATGGCLALISAGMVLVGFVLPWFTCTIGTFISGSFSGLGALIQLVFGTLLSMIGTAGSRSSDATALGGLLIIVLIVVTLFIALTPLMGLQIGRLGLRLLQSLKSSNEQRRRTARAIAWAAGIGLVPLLCYFSGAATNINLSGLSAIGLPVVVRSADVGLWVTMSGFGLAFIAGIVISTAASLAEQLPKPPAKDKGV